MSDICVRKLQFQQPVTDRQRTFNQSGDKAGSECVYIYMSWKLYCYT